MLVLNKLKHVVADWQLRRVRLRTDSAMLSFPDDLRSPKHVLVLLPAGLRELTLVKQFLPTITHLFKPADISLLSMPGVRLHDIYPRKGFQILSPTLEHLMWSGMPKRSYLQTLAEQKYDTIVDLNLEPCHFTSAVLLSFPNAVRMVAATSSATRFTTLKSKPSTCETSATYTARCSRP